MKENLGFAFGSKFGESLVGWGFLRADQVKVVLLEQKKFRKPFGQVALKLGFISEADLTRAVAKYFNLDFVDLEKQVPCRECLSLLNEELARNYTAVVFNMHEGVIGVAISDPGDLVARAEIERNLAHLQMKVKFFCAPTSQLQKILSGDFSLLSKLDYETAVETVNDILSYAVKNNASDIHFEPLQDVLRIRMRIDGMLSLFKEMHIESWTQVKGRIKIIGGLNIAESRMPQSGHANVIINNKNINLRIAVHPSVFGEAIVVRLLDIGNDLLNISKLGFPDDITSKLKTIINKPSGMFIVAGPTGAGKTTTLYALINELHNKHLNIMTLEDPVEYQVPGLRQLDLREEGILSFADGIRSALRQDPDVMLIGEIRDENTAAMTVRAALTGRLVVATVHAVDVGGSIPRLLDLGITLHDLSACLVGIMSQRLMRKLCIDCRGKGCEKCYQSGYSGRVGVAELLVANDDMKMQMLSQDFSVKEMLANPDNGFKNMREYAENLVKEGATNIEEVTRVLGKV